MTRKIVAMLLCVCLLAAQAMALGDVVTDMKGREISLAGPATRVVALSAADCEIMYAIGAGDLLVGRGAYCNYPEEVLTLPAVDSGAETNVEAILALEPDVVLMNTMAQTVEQVEMLENAGVKVVVSEATDIAGVYQAIDMIGVIVGKQAQADALKGDMRAKLAAIAQTGLSGKTVYFEVSPLAWGLWTAGSGTFMDEMAALVGLENAFHDVNGWAEISQEQVLDRDPDYVFTITAYMGQGETPVEEIMHREGWDHLKAVGGENVYQLDGDMISRPGPRLVDAALMIAEAVKGNE